MQVELMERNEFLLFYQTFVGMRLKQPPKSKLPPLGS